MQLDKTADCLTSKIGRRVLGQRVHSEHDFVVELSKVFDAAVIEMMTSEWETSHCYVKLPWK
jgi:hypothetical protein